jgi:hypothetical protein
VALALIDADQHPLGVDVQGLQMDQFRDPQAAAVGRHQQHAVLEVLRGVQQLGDLAAAERFRQPSAPFGRDPQAEVFLPQDLAVEKADARQLLVAGAEGHFPLGDQIMEKVTDLLDGDRIG